MLFRRIIFFISFVAIVAALGIGVRYLPSWEWFVMHEDAIRERVAANPIAGWLVGVLVYTVASLIPGTGGKSVLCGWLFGFWGALFMVEIGLTAAALLSFLYARYAVRTLLRKRWQARLRLLSRRFEREGAFYLLLLRLAHAPFTAVNYAAGATRVPCTTFWWTTHLGILPGTALFTYAGARVPTLKVISENGLHAFLDVRLILALIAVLCMPLLMRPALRTMRAWKLRRGPCISAQVS